MMKNFLTVVIDHSPNWSDIREEFWSYWTLLWAVMMEWTGPSQMFYSGDTSLKSTDSYNINGKSLG